LADDRGEQVRIAATSKLDENILKAKLEKRFTDFLKRKPSGNEKNFQYGKKIWIDYPNNTLEWDKFKINNPVFCFPDFAETTSLLVMDLLQEDTSKENVFSIALFLFVQLLKVLDVKDKKKMIIKQKNEMLDSLDNFEHFSIIHHLGDYSGVDCNSIVQTIEEYDSESNNPIKESDTFNKWRIEARNSINNENRIFVFQNLGFIISELLGLSDTHNIIILQFISRWLSEKDFNINIR
jgi:hypothetical protein